MTNIEIFKQTLKQMIPEIKIEESESALVIQKFSRMALPKSYVENNACDPEKLAQFFGSELLKGEFIIKIDPNNRLVKYRSLLVKSNIYYKLINDIEAEVLDALICLNCQNSVIPEGECCVTCGRTG